MDRKSIENIELQDSDAAGSGQETTAGNGELERQPAAAKTRQRKRTAAELQAELERTEEKFKRLAAEFANYKKRVEQERDWLWERISNQVYAAILPLFDDFLRLLEHAEENSPLHEGIQAIVQKWEQWLQQHSIERLDQTGTAFDPELHDALIRQPVNDPTQEGQIVQVIEPGYKRGDTVLRHARVAVGHYEPEKAARGNGG